MVDSDSVKVTTVVGVDRATAFHVFTEEVDFWWKRGPRFRVDPSRASTMRFEPHVGGRFLEVYDEASDDAFEHGKVRAWEPHERVVFEMRGRDLKPDERTEVEILFETVELGTRVTGHHRGWDAFADDHPVRHGLVGDSFSDMMGAWWVDLLTAIRSRAASRMSS